MNFSSKDVGRMTLKFWFDLYSHFKIYHNFKVKKCIFDLKREQLKTKLKNNKTEEWLPF